MPLFYRKATFLLTSVNEMKELHIDGLSILPNLVFYYLIFLVTMVRNMFKLNPCFFFPLTLF